MMRQRAAYFLLALFAGSGAVVGVAISSYRLTTWTGGAYLQLLIMVSIPVSFLGGLTAAIAGPRVPTSQGRLAVPILLGFVPAILWVFIWHASYMGWGSYYTPIQIQIQGWALSLAGGVLGLMAVGVARPGTLRQRGLSSAAFVLAFFLLVVAPRPFFDWYTKNQELTLVAAYLLPEGSQPPPEDQQLQSFPRPYSFLSWEEVQDALRIAEQDTRLAGISNELEFLFAYRYGRGKKSRMVLLLQHPIQADTELPVPDAGVVVYVQDGPEWRRHPEHSPALTRHVEAERPWDLRDKYGLLRIPDSGGIGVIVRLQRAEPE